MAFSANENIQLQIELEIVLFYESILSVFQ